MKKKLLPGILVTVCFFVASPLLSQTEHSQAGNNDTYAVTDIERNGVKWNSLRTLDLRTGAYSSILVHLLNGNETQPPPGTTAAITYNGVAAIAHDQKNKKLYYTPMLTDKLYYIDLRTMNRHLVTSQFTGLMPKASDQSNIVTRMVIGDDNKGYALTNDGRHLLRFRTNNNNPSVTDLGSLVDAPGNNEMSVHNLCNSFGGDLIADDDDHLYLITSRNHVFKINIQTRLTRYTGTISNLPPNFTTSGTVVDKQEKKIVVVSAVDSSDLYTLNLETLAGTPFHANRPYHPSDLANSAVLKKKRPHGHDDRIVFTGSETGGDVQLYPNPVTGGEFKIQFTDVPAGGYTIDITDARGKSMLVKAITLVGKNNIIAVRLPGVNTSGMYYVRITGNNKIYTTKILVE